MKNNLAIFNYIENSSAKTLEIAIHGEISWWEDNDSKTFYKKLEENKDKSKIIVDINSPGGRHYDGVAINNALRNHPAKIVTRISGLAASAAATIFAAGDEREIPANGNAMVHKPMIDAGYKNADELRKHADNLDKVQVGVEKSLERVFNDPSKVKNYVNETTWFTAEEAFNEGFATKIIDDVEIKNCFEFSPTNLGYTAPDEILNKFDVKHKDTLLKKIFKNKKEKEPKEMELKDIKAQMDKMQGAIDNLTNLNKESQEQLTKALDTVKNHQETIAKQTDEIKALREKNVTSAKDLRTQEFKSFLNAIIDKVPPAEHDTHINVMEMLYNVDESQLEAYKNTLKNRSVTVNLDGHFASNEEHENFENDGEADIDKKVRAVMEENEKKGVYENYGDIFLRLAKK